MHVGFDSVSRPGELGAEMEMERTLVPAVELLAEASGETGRQAGAFPLPLPVLLLWLTGIVICIVSGWSSFGV